MIEAITLGKMASIIANRTPKGLFLCSDGNLFYGCNSTGNGEVLVKEFQTYKDCFQWLENENQPICDCVEISLIRNRVCENEQWANVIHLVLKPDEDAEQWEDILRSRIRDYLTTPEGWKENCFASQDYNWGDLINNLPASVATFDPPANARVVACQQLSVNQDELLAPEDVPASFVTRKGETTNTYPCRVDFMDGTIYPNQCHFMEFDEAYVCLKDNCFPCDPEAEYMRLSGGFLAANNI